MDFDEEEYSDFDGEEEEYDSDSDAGPAPCLAVDGLDDGEEIDLDKVRIIPTHAHCIFPVYGYQCDKMSAGAPPVQEPETAEEYLRQVHYQAMRMPKVLVASSNPSTSSSSGRVWSGREVLAKMSRCSQKLCPGPGRGRRICPCGSVALQGARGRRLPPVAPGPSPSGSGTLSLTSPS